MRAMDSAMALAKVSGVPLRVYWARDQGLNCRFDQLFQPIADIELIESPAPITLQTARKKNLFWPDLVRKLSGVRYIDQSEVGALIEQGFDFEQPTHEGDLFISSFSRFFPNECMYEAFQPIPELVTAIEEETQAFDPATIGVHIRRTDNIESIAKSPLQAFMDAMEKAVKENGGTTFYLATDSDDTKRELTDHFGQRIITGWHKADRNSVAGIQRALVELFALSRTSRLFGSYYSSFSHTAAHLGSIPEITIQAAG